LPAKIVVTPYRGGSRVTLVGTSGKELLSSEVFHEPRAKGATVRSLKSLLGDAVTVEDHTVGTARASTKTATKGARQTAPAATQTRPAATKRTRSRAATKVGSRSMDGAASSEEQEITAETV
jgi:hypothetical protein